MAVYESKLNTDAAGFTTNRQDMLSLIESYNSIRDRAAQRSEQRRPRFDERRQLTPRERLLIIEAMKIQHEILAQIDGVVKSITTEVGKQVGAEALLVEIEAG
jgi:hypothetical protein